MDRKILIVNPPGEDLSTLIEAFAAAAGPDGELRVLDEAGALSSLLRTQNGYDLIVLDWHLGDGARNGPDLIAEIHAISPDMPVVAVAERGDVETAALAVNAGAADFLVRGPQLPERVNTLLGKVRKLFRLLDKTRQLDARVTKFREDLIRRHRIVGGSPQYRELIETVHRVATIPRPILVTGERGTGKELVARAIHTESGKEGAIITVNCAAFTDALLENELFGHERGAFTGAEKAMPGKFELALGGTLFLDEIGHMSLSFQQKILRVVEYGTFTRVGGAKEVRTDARIIAATNADLNALMEEGRFLPDLYDRISFEVIRVPPLRERPEDIETLAHYFLDGFAAEIPAFRGKRLSPRALAALHAYEFPGNVRELKNLIERAAYRDTTNEITPEDIGLLNHGHADSDQGTFSDRVDAFRERLIRDALEQAGGNQARAARSLGLTYDQFRHYFRKYRSG
jgi:DNA-binding NtrC family response regulator